MLCNNKRYNKQSLLHDNDKAGITNRHLEIASNLWYGFCILWKGGYAIYKYSNNNSMSNNDDLNKYVYVLFRIDTWQLIYIWEPLSLILFQMIPHVQIIKIYLKFEN